MTETLKPETPDQLCEAVRWAAAAEEAFEVLAAGTKRSFGRPVEAGHRLDLGVFAGIGLYEAEELVLAAGAATPLAEIEAALADKRQRLEFEPPDLGPLLGAAPRLGTIGGAIACNLAGPRRIKAGAARDHVLGFNAVSGRGEIFKSGGRVVKNVTGFDLSKLMAGSFGTLAVMTEVTVKVLPVAEETRTVLVLGADDAAAGKAMSAALGAPSDVSGAAHLTAPVASASGIERVAGAGGAVTALRLEGPAPSVKVRARAIGDLMKNFGELDELGSADSAVLWREVGNATFFAGDDGGPVWRLSVPPAAGARVAAHILDGIEGKVFYDWGGGLMWLALAPTDDGGHGVVRSATAQHGGHATLVRAAAGVRTRVPVFEPQPAPLAALTKRVKEGFDPLAVLNPGRMVAGV
ncbi:MAG: glycolate oxidase subunit GlcE [Rhodospirillales bacterium]|jgi:glycolate oxidase FAD binding subunit|nr:glycolate oxidase subunit GlcE [Rhodospirillales bacterium]HJO71256.1 glycolate oxidase subunit GlcE [Rhodospirillales bacterium]